MLFKPDLARELPADIADESVDAEAITALSAWLLTQDGEVSSAVLIQSFQGTTHEALFAAEQAEIMQWGETFDVDAEFLGVLAKLREESRKKKFNEMNLKMSGKDFKALSDQERALYLQLFKPG